MVVSYAYIIALILLPIITSGDQNPDLIVQINSGTVRGKIVTGYTKKEVRAFYGIPYAIPPIGKLRFKPPVPVTPWQDTFDATRDPIPCYQQYTRESFGMSKLLRTTVRRPWSEDCLTLNVWTELETQDAATLVYIHGGGFTTGSGGYPYVDSSTNTAEAALISVSMNYRLGVFGFLSLGVTEFPGNLGLMDQQLALKWVRDNIESFGGKRDAVLLFGLDAGGASVGYQILLSENEGLFKTGILIDGSPTCSWAWQTKEKAGELAESLIRSLDCVHSNVTVKIECLQNAHPEDILDASFFDETAEHFKPNIDGNFIKETADEALKAGRMIKVNVIAENTVNAGSVHFLNMNKDILEEPEPGLTAENFGEAMKRLYFAFSDSETIIQDWYLGRACQANRSEILSVAVDAYTDGLAVCCTNAFLEYATRKGLLTYKVVWGIPDPKFPAWVGSHSQVVQYAISSEIMNPQLKYDPEVQKMTQDFMQAVKLFVRQKASELQQIVPAYNLKDRPYWLFDAQPRVLQHHRSSQCVLWNEILPAMKKIRNAC